MVYETEPYVGVYQVLGDVLVNTTVPPGAKGAMFSIVDRLRASSAPLEDCRAAEEISLAIHKLETALFRGDTEALKAVRAELKSIAAAWLRRRVGEGGRRCCRPDQKMMRDGIDRQHRPQSNLDGILAGAETAP